MLLGARGVGGADRYRWVLVGAGGDNGYRRVPALLAGTQRNRCPQVRVGAVGAVGRRGAGRDLVDLSPPVPGRSSTRKRRFLAAAGAGTVD